MLEMEALGVQVRVGKYKFPLTVVWWQRLEKEAPMKRFFVGKTYPIAPITTPTTALANDQLPFPKLPSPPAPPSLPLLPPVVWQQKFDLIATKRNRLERIRTSDLHSLGWVR